MQDNVSIQYKSCIGNNVIIGSGTSFGRSTLLEDDCFVSLDATICGFAQIDRSSFLGAKGCVVGGLLIAQDCVISAGAVVLKSTAPRRVYVGNPACPAGHDNLETFAITLTELFGDGSATATDRVRRHLSRSSVQLGDSLAGLRQVVQPGCT